MKINFANYKNPVFVETGTAGGEGVEAALEAGFSVVKSIEANEDTFELSRKKFLKESKVTLYLGDSAEILPDILEDITERCTFWLDAHYCGDGSVGEKFPYTLVKELTAISKHHIKDHTIIIDDMRLLRDTSTNNGFCTCDIEELVLAINKRYDIEYVEGIVENDILIAKI